MQSWCMHVFNNKIMFKKKHSSLFVVIVVTEFSMLLQTDSVIPSVVLSK